MLDAVLKALLLLRDGVPPSSLDMNYYIDIVILNMQSRGQHELVEATIKDIERYRPTATKLY